MVEKSRLNGERDGEIRFGVGIRTESLVGHDAEIWNVKSNIDVVGEGGGDES